MSDASNTPVTTSPAPRLSIVVPVHNAAPWLRRCVESLQAQTIAGEMEVVLVENGSTDGSASLCRELASQFGNVKFVVSEKTGPSEARNCGIMASSGRYVGFVDADDTVHPDMFRQLVEAKERFRAGCAYCNYRLIMAGGTEKYPFADSGNVLLRTAADVAFDIITDRSTSGPCMRVFDRRFFDNHRFPEGIFYEDHSTAHAWMADVERIVHVDKPLYDYHIHPGSTTTTTDSNLPKLRDFFRAEMVRLEFVNTYRYFTPSQRVRARRAVVKGLLRRLRSCIRLSATCANASSETSGVPSGAALAAENMRTAILTLSPSLLKGLGLKLSAKLLALRYFWPSYRRHYLPKQ